MAPLLGTQTVGAVTPQPGESDTPALPKEAETPASSQAA